MARPLINSVRQVTGQALQAIRKYTGAAISQPTRRHLGTPSTAPAPHPSQEVKLRSLRQSEVPFMTRFWASQGVDMGEAHFGSVLNILAPTGYLVATVDNAFAGSCVHLIVNDQIGIQAGLMAMENYRSLGIARKVRFAGNHLLEGLNVGADAVPDMVETYKRWGFKHVDFTNDVYGGHLKKAGLLEQDPPQMPIGYSMVPLSDVDFREVDAFDKTFHPPGLSRTIYMKWMLELKSNLGFVIKDEYDQIQALGARLDLGNGRYNFGPIYSRDAFSAELLLRQLVVLTPEGAAVDMMVPSANQNAIRLVRLIGLHKVTESVRICTKALIDMPVQQLFSYTNLGYAGFQLC